MSLKDYLSEDLPKKAYEGSEEFEADLDKVSRAVDEAAKILTSRKFAEYCKLTDKNFSVKTESILIVATKKVIDLKGLVSQLEREIEKAQ